MNFYLLTIRSSKDISIFDTAEDYQNCLRMFTYLKNDYNVDIRGFCLMPHFLKLVIGLNPFEVNKKLSVLCKDDRLFAWQKITGVFPQSMSLMGQCVRITDRKRLSDVLEYIECEPVRAGLVEHSEEYPFSSAHIRHSAQTAILHDHAEIAISKQKFAFG